MYVKNTKYETYRTVQLKDEEGTLGEPVEFDVDVESRAYVAEVDDDVGEAMLEAYDHIEAIDKSEVDLESDGVDDQGGNADAGDSEEATIPDELPDDYRELQDLAQSVGIDATQSQEKLESELAAYRDAN